MAVVGYENLTYRWRQGFVNEAQLTATYNITAFAKTADMGSHRWFNPEGSNVYNQAAQIEATLAGSANFIGKAWFDWRLPGLSPQMLDFILYDATMFNGLARMNSTVSTWNGLRDRWEVVWTIAKVDIVSVAGETGFERGLRALVVNHIVQQDAP